MKKSEIVEFFGGIQQVADALGITYQSVREWPEDRVPEGRQYQIQVITKGKLKVSQKRETAA
jgi:transcriptional repressor of cell division inhibition gene dicB